ncbi:hypothetical protein [Catellatospora sichuanensis]|uniref:hypothetical protein n=1 Tax=Catellatospora sichuanensis TaxID=1969805 RepID=UPI0011835C89|nr:hypothetical protein [Catellatospora sichuanensis]
MNIRSACTRVLALALGLTSTGVTACASNDEPPVGRPSVDASQDSNTLAPDLHTQDTEVRMAVENYLDAVKHRDVAQGRLLICADVREKFDAVATTDAGAFSARFTLVAYSIADTRFKGTDVQVRAAQEISVAGQAEPEKTTIVYTMTRTADGWCIAHALPDRT